MTSYLPASFAPYCEFFSSVNTLGALMIDLPASLSELPVGQSIAVTTISECQPPYFIAKFRIAIRLLLISQDVFRNSDKSARPTLG